jgi:hypothetical protein
MHREKEIRQSEFTLLTVKPDVGLVSIALWMYFQYPIRYNTSFSMDAQ